MVSRVWVRFWGWEGQPTSCLFFFFEGLHWMFTSVPSFGSIPASRILPSFYWFVGCCLLEFKMLPVLNVNNLQTVCFAIFGSDIQWSHRCIEISSMDWRLAFDELWFWKTVVQWPYEQTYEALVQPQCKRVSPTIRIKTWGTGSTPWYSRNIQKPLKWTAGAWPSCSLKLSFPTDPDRFRLIVIAWYWWSFCFKVQTGWTCLFSNVETADWGRHNRVVSLMETSWMMHSQLICRKCTVRLWRLCCCHKISAMWTTFHWMLGGRCLMVFVLWWKQVELPCWSGPEGIGRRGCFFHSPIKSKYCFQLLFWHHHFINMSLKQANQLAKHKQKSTNKQPQQKPNPTQTPNATQLSP